MPSTSPRQHAFMEAIAHDPAFARRVGVPAGVGQEFVAADRHYADGGAVDDPLPEDEYAWLERALARRPRNRGYAVGGGIDTIGDREINTQRASNASPQQLYDSLIQNGATPAQAAQLAGLSPSGSINDWSKTLGNVQNNWQTNDPMGALSDPMDMAMWGTMALLTGGLAGSELGLLGAGADAGGGLGVAVDPMVYGGTGAATWGAGDAAALGAGSGLGAEVDPMMYGGGDAGTYGTGAEAGTGAGYQYGNGFDSSQFNAGNMPGDIGPPASTFGSPTDYNYQNGSDIQSDVASNTGVAPPGAVNAGADTTITPPSMTITPPSTGFGLPPGMSASSLVKLITAAIGAGGSGGSGGASAPQGYVSHEIDPGYSLMPPGWRSDRPLYVPGQDAIPDGWFGAGHTGG